MTCARVQVKWVRPNELKATTNAKLFIDDPNEDGDGGAEANDIMQGPLGDCYLLSSLGILCSSPNGLVTKLFIECEYFDQGLVGLKFFKDGMWWDVAVDTFIPTTDNNCPCFARYTCTYVIFLYVLHVFTIMCIYIFHFVLVRSALCVVWEFLP